MNSLLVLPVLIPLASAALLLLMRGRLSVQRWGGVAAHVALLGGTSAVAWSVWTDGIQVLYVGSWPAPAGITLVADMFSAIMLMLAAVMGLLIGIYALADIDRPRMAFGFYPLLQFLLMGVCGAFLAGDVFNLYVWFEVMLISSFVLLALGGERAQLEGAIKYVTLNLVASAIFLAGIGILYGATETLNMADLALKLGQFEEPRMTSVLAVLFLVAFGIKSAAFPLFFWLPAAYHTPPVAVTAVFSGLLTKVGVYSMVRFFTLMFVHDREFTHSLILLIAGLTMVTGVLGAVAQTDMRRLLSFHIVSQIGYLLMGLGLFTTLALAGTIFFMVHVVIAKAALFLVAGVIHRLRGSYDLKRLGGLYQEQPGLAILFLVPAMALAGLPPLSGFFAKLILVRAGLEVGQYAIVATALGVGMLTLFSMMKIWNEAFWKPLPGDALEPLAADADAPSRWLAGSRLVLPIAVLAVGTVAVGIAAGPLLELATVGAEQLLNPEGYIRAVLGAGADGSANSLGVR